MEQLSFQEQMRSHGLFARTVSVEHLDELREDIDALRRAGQIDPALDKEYLSQWGFAVPAELPDARTLVIVAKPQPALSVIFRWKGREVPLTVPPTYAGGEVDAEVLAALAKVTSPNSFRFVKAWLPLKALAVRSGLAAYGRNDLAYIPTFGSFHRLTAFFTDLPCGEDQWQEQEMLPGCDSCDACVKACPTGAIPTKRAPVRAHRCLTYLNEKDAEAAFPDALPKGVHHALVGCMRCQRVCPYDRNVASWVEARGEFSEEETDLLLAGPLPDGSAVGEKLRQVGLSPSLFPRNLAVLLELRE